jgi:two-component system sensor histidine kinase KdpD
MTEQRPNPDDLLARVEAEARNRRRGRLKLYFGYAAGVGKTYSMLEDARQAKAQGRDVVVGYVEPHGRKETEALLEGLESIPIRSLEYRGVTLHEFDVDAALARSPDLLLVDELAHTNAAGSRYEKRWQDVEELLDAGIDVWTTMNVQHIESLNDIIGRITGVVVRETVPDQVFDRADELELVDITPDALLNRLKAGNVYLPEQARRAVDNFFRVSNLNALRELSLRQAARRVHSEVESIRRVTAAGSTWATSDRLLVCVGPSPTTSRVIRTAKRMATALDAPWIAMSVDLTGAPDSSPGKQSISQHFRLAERLGAETVTLAGQNVTDSIIEYARSRNVTKILIGRTDQPRWRRILFGTVVDEMLERSGDIDVYVIHGDDLPADGFLRKFQWGIPAKWPYVRATMMVGVASIVASVFRVAKVADREANAVMVFLAAVVWTAYREGRGPAVLASLLAVMAFDFFFVPPLYTFVVADAEYVVTFLVMLTIGLVISSLTSRLRAQVAATRQRERRTSALYELGKKLASLYGKVFLVSAAAESISELTGGDVAVYLRRTGAEPELVFDRNAVIASHPISASVAQWVIDHDQVAGAGTETLPNAVAQFVPLSASQRTLGAIALRVPEPESLLDPDMRRLVEACANLLAMAVERDQMALDAADSRVQAEAEQLRSSLLSSVSHDLKTPLAAIAGTCDSLLESDTIAPATRRQLLEGAADEARRLNRLLENILQMSRLEAGAAVPNRQWHVLEEIVGSAIRRTREELRLHRVAVVLPESFPLVYVDDILFEQVFVNLLENAARHTPSGTLVTIRADIDGKTIRISISDDGPGIPAGAVDRIFDKFYRASPNSDGSRGSGLGLAICRAIVRGHGGTIHATDRPGGGAEFVIRMPLRDDTPRVEVV